MATRGRIGIQLSDDSILSIYCHYDNYPEFQGRVLRDHYDTPEKVKALIDGGDVSCTWTNAGWNNETLPEVGPLYYSARGEDCPPRYDNSMNDFLSNGEEYSYVFTSAGWVCYDMNEFNDNDPEIVEIPSGALAC